MDPLRGEVWEAHLPGVGDHRAVVLTINARYVNATDLHTVDKPRLRRRRGLLSPGEMATLEDAIRLYLGL